MKMNKNKNIAIEVNNVSKSFLLPHEKTNSIKGVFVNLFKPRSNKTTQRALKDINFQIKKGEFFGIVGRNGSGKSTMLKILAKIYQPTGGSVKIRGKLVPFIELGVGFNPELTGRENVYLNGSMLGFSRTEVESMYDSIVEFAELKPFMDQKLKNYSSGMQVRLAFSMATRADADILLIDEVLAVGDADFQRKCFNYFKQLKRQGKTVVFVSHDMNAVREYCDRAVMIEKNEIIASGKANKIATQYTRMFIEEAKQDNKTKNKVSSKRWGSGELKHGKPTINVGKENVEIKVCVKAMSDVKGANFGFSISNAAGEKLFGTNSILKKQHIDNIKNGDEINIKWGFPNVLRDGEYFVDLAAVSTSNDVWDWWDEAETFIVYKEEKTMYPVHPDMHFYIEIKNNAQ